MSQSHCVYSRQEREMMYNLIQPRALYAQLKGYTYIKIKYLKSIYLASRLQLYIVSFVGTIWKYRLLQTLFKNIESALHI